MIIDFTIENFRSIKTAQTFSLHVEVVGQHLLQHVVYPALDKIGVLRSAGIYGANASGKSNLLLAFLALRFIATESGDLKEGDPIPCYEPYRLAAANKNAPVKFEIEFFNHDQVRYLYSVVFDREQIIEEILDYYPSRQKANLFTRTATDTWETISFGGRYKGGVKRIPFFRNNSYLSKAGENAGASDIIRSVYKYMKRNLVHLQAEQDIYHTSLFGDKDLIAKTARFLARIDTGIADIQTRVNEKKVDLGFFEKFPKEVREMLEKKVREEYLFAHRSETDELELFEQELESSGTQKLFNLIPLLIGAFAGGNVLIVDELDRSFHPHIAEMIIKLFNDPAVNTNHAQLIFSTHNTSLMTPEKLRRDQIWFSEKTQGATVLYSLDHFDKSKVKSNSPFADWYNAGRFDAIPTLDYLSIADLLRSNPAGNAVPDKSEAMS